MPGTLVNTPTPLRRWWALRRITATVALALVLSGAVLGGPAGAQSSSDDVTAKGAPPGDSESSATPPATTGPVVRQILFPVVGPVTFGDTFGACRSGCTRTHKGVDIFGTRLAPLVAVTDGTIVSVRRSALTLAGNMVTIRDDEGWYYLYLHLNNDSPGTDDGSNPQGWILANRLRVGSRVKAGDVIGYLGDSGNAETVPAHVHFEIHPPGQGAINPTPSVQGAKDAGRVRPAAELASSAAGRAKQQATVTSWYQALMKRAPTSKEQFAWSDRMAVGLGDSNDLIADLTMAPQRRDPAGAVMRAYRVVLGRRPDAQALKYWEARYRAGDRSEAISFALIGSTEFGRRGQLSDAQFVDVIYRNARGTGPTGSVRQYWLDQMAAGRTRASVAANFVDSFGVKDATWHDLEVLEAFRAVVDRMPTDAEWTQWRKYLDNGGLLPDVVGSLRS